MKTSLLDTRDLAYALAKNTVRIWTTQFVTRHMGHEWGFRKGNPRQVLGWKGRVGFNRYWLFIGQYYIYLVNTTYLVIESDPYVHVRYSEIYFRG